MNRWIIPLLSYLLPLRLAAQTDRLPRGPETPYNPDAGYKTWSIKGKILPFPIGIDGYAYYQNDNEDDITDTAGVNHQNGVEVWHSWEKAVFLNYRYYFSFRRLRNKSGLVPYLLVFLRYGQLDQYFDPLYPVSSYLSNHEFHSSAGMVQAMITRSAMPGWDCQAPHGSSYS